MSEMQNILDIWSQCFGYDFSDIISDIRNGFRVCYDTLPKQPPIYNANIVLKG